MDNLAPQEAKLPMAGEGNGQGTMLACRKEKNCPHSTTEEIEVQRG
jgi:hypothetical protein